MAMLVFDLHKEHYVSISQPCCYSFSIALTGENRKQREKEKGYVQEWRGGQREGFLVVEEVLAFPLSLTLSFSPYAVLPA